MTFIANIARLILFFFRILLIGFNKIHSIATQSFINLANLHILILQHNRLETIQTDTLTGKYKDKIFVLCIYLIY